MKANKVQPIFDRKNYKVFSQNIAFHLAGHAAAIYLNNKAQNLPPVFFQITLKDIKPRQDRDPNFQRLLEGGRLIETLPCSEDLTDDYITAFDADIVNLLIGPLAEAKYVHECDNEPFTQNLITLTALIHYGGCDKIALVYEYLQSLYASKEQQDEKLHSLFGLAFNFVNAHGNWQAITHLANHIHASNKNIIRYEEVVSVLESREAKAGYISNFPAIRGAVFLPRRAG